MLHWTSFFELCTDKYGIGIDGMSSGDVRAKSGIEAGGRK